LKLWGSLDAREKAWYTYLLVTSLPEMFDSYASLHRADNYRPAPRGYYVVRSLLIWGGAFGVLVGLYRNDVFRELSRKIGQESRYLAVESQLIGTPGWGTPRSMEPLLGGAAAPAVVSTPAPTVEPAAPPSVPAVESPAPVAVPAAPPKVVAAVAPTAPATPPPITEAEALVPVSLDSLPLAGGNAAPPSSPAEPALRAAAPAPNLKSVKPSPTEARAPAKLAKAAPQKPAAPPAPKATQARASDNPLTAAIRGAVRARPASDAIPK
jgi:hypothetical protein